jgi:hypothetical protein
LELCSPTERYRLGAPPYICVVHSTYLWKHQVGHPRGPRIAMSGDAQCWGSELSPPNSGLNNLNILDKHLNYFIKNPWFDKYLYQHLDNQDLALGYGSKPSTHVVHTKKTLKKLGFMDGMAIAAMVFQPFWSIPICGSLSGCWTYIYPQNIWKSFWKSEA